MAKNKQNMNQQTIRGLPTVEDSKFISDYKGICMYSTTNVNVIDNVIDNNNYAITMELSANNTITGCTISNSGLGVQLLRSSNSNSIYYNNFINNKMNAWDWGINQWDYENKGNYWSNYSGIDENSDGVGDIPYTIGEFSKDNYPLMEQIETEKKNKTPGFEFIVLIIIISAIFFHKKKKIRFLANPFAFCSYLFLTIPTKMGQFLCRMI
ncbi:MAG: NosD domain-containing protein [Candidatus Thermoplasmatota archaeon]|nr:NosD domain-containing protein [Candidatus Thermoplasmatota archaeon]